MTLACKSVSCFRDKTLKNGDSPESTTIEPNGGHLGQPDLTLAQKD